MYQNVIFDLDGTLLDTLQDLADACNWVCQRHGWPTHPVEDYTRFVGNGAYKLLERVAPPDVEPAPELISQTMEEFTQRYSAHKSDHTTVYDGMPETLARLKGAGVRLAVLSNKPHQAAGPVVERHYPGVFQFVQGALPDVPTKPDPTLLHRLMEEMGASPEDTLFVGDSDVDIRTAKNGGLDSCGVLWGFRTRAELEREGAGFLAAHPAELGDLILPPGRKILETERLTLREMTDEDFPGLCRMLQDPEVMYAYEHAFPDDEAWEWLRRQRERYRRDGIGLWAVLEKSSGQMVGQCGLTWQDCGGGEPVMEVGYLLEKAAWHKGFATEAARACRDYAFQRLGAEEVYSIIRDSNLSSQKVARRNSMALRGQFVKHYHGVDMPHLIFSVRREK